MRSSFRLGCLVSIAPVLLAGSADRLPLERGLFVRAGLACAGASRADTLSYRGEAEGINSAQGGCRIRRLRRSGRAYTIRQRCVGETLDQTSADVVVIADRKTFTIDGERYRWCGPFGSTSPASGG